MNSSGTSILGPIFDATKQRIAATSSVAPVYPGWKYDWNPFLETSHNPPSAAGGVS